MIHIFGYLGFIGGLLCAFGDLLLDLKGKDNKEIGPFNSINTKWSTMSEWRFKYSALLAFFGVPMYLLGLTGMAELIGRSDQSLGITFFIISVAGSIGGFFIHAFLCVTPIIYKRMEKTGDKDAIFNVIKGIYNVIMIPFIVSFLLLIGGTSGIIIYAIIKGYLELPIFMIFLTPLCLTIIGVTLRKVKNDWFYDLPGIIMPSTGLSVIGLMVILLS